MLGLLAVSVLGRNCPQDGATNEMLGIHVGKCFCGREELHGVFADMHDGDKKQAGPSALNPVVLADASC